MLFQGIFIFALGTYFSCRIPHSLPIIDDKLFSAIERIQGNTIYLKSGTLNFKTPIYIYGNTFIKGNNTIIRISENTTPIFILEGIKTAKIENIKFVGEKLANSNSKDFLEKANLSYIIRLINTFDVEINNCQFINHYGTGIHCGDAIKLNIQNCNFENFGVTTYSGVNYSYDAIFIGAYNKTSNITISHCSFKNIGSSFPSQDSNSINDGDGIQIQTSAISKYIKISNCYFSKCSARGIKVMSGHNLNIENNNFSDCTSAVILAVMQYSSRIRIINNKIDRAVYAFGSNSMSDRIIIDSLILNGNKVEQAVHFFRTSGNSLVINSEFSNNEIKDVGMFFIAGRFMDTRINNNLIHLFGTSRNPSYFMAFEIWKESNNVIIEDNMLTPMTNRNKEFVNHSNMKIIFKNKMKQPKYLD